jgi:hypothetical protein
MPRFAEDFEKKLREKGNPGFHQDQFNIIEI